MNDELQNSKNVSRSLDERFAKRPHTYKRLQEIADLMDQAIAQGATADEAEAMAIEQSGPRLFLNITGKSQIGVFDREKKELLTTWNVPDAEQNVPMAFDEASHRLFIATRKPPKMIVFDTESGHAVASLPASGRADDMRYATGSRPLPSCGQGAHRTGSEDCDLCSGTESAVCCRVGQGQGSSQSNDLSGASMRVADASIFRTPRRLGQNVFATTSRR